MAERDLTGISNLAFEMEDNIRSRSETAFATPMRDDTISLQMNDIKTHDMDEDILKLNSKIEMNIEEEEEKEENEEEEEDVRMYGLSSYFESWLEGNGGFSRKLESFRTNVDLGKLIREGAPFALLVAYFAYLIAVIVINSSIQDDDFWCSGDGFLYVLTIVVGIALIYFQIIKKYFGRVLTRTVVDPISTAFSKISSYRAARWGFALVVVALLVIFFVLDTVDQRRRLISLVGIAFVLIVGFLFSHAPRKIIWRCVIWGMAIQFLLALLVLRWPLGNDILGCLSDKVSLFLGYSKEGAIFVFGSLAEEPMSIFAFTVLPVTIFFSFCTNILYYYGAIQWLVVKVGWLFKITIGTNMCESMNAAGSIFLGMTESPLLIKPYLHIMTNSELYAVMAAGFATVAGSVLAAYISLGADAGLLLTASVMNAPAALALSKLFYPDMRKSRIDAKTVGSVKSTEVNALHAGCVGVTNAIPLVANIAANLVAFISFVAFINAVFDWSCQLVDFEEGACSLEGTFGYIFMPVSWMMGVRWEDCYEVGQLLGLKIIVNEFVAYTKLSEFMELGILSERSEAIATFALCGFGNVSAVGIMMGGIGSLAPERKEDMAKIAFQAMIAGSLATYSSACIAATLMNYSDAPQS